MEKKGEKVNFFDRNQEINVAENGIKTSIHSIIPGLPNSNKHYF
ncbi:hypothetical protein [Oceanobacillus chungangensis]|nr:hypothetical protein [Oceanobacillus chungangensis]